MTPEERAAAWTRCAELRKQLEALLKGEVAELRVAQSSQTLLAELDHLEDRLAVDLIQQDGDEAHAVELGNLQLSKQL